MLDLKKLQERIIQDGGKVIVEEIPDNCFDAMNFVNLVDIQNQIILRPDKKSIPKLCFNNVKNYVEENSGAISCYGWMFMEFKFWNFNSYLPHVIVKENDEFIDITPRIRPLVGPPFPFLLDPTFDLLTVDKFLFHGGFQLGLSKDSEIFKLKFPGAPISG